MDADSVLELAHDQAIQYPSVVIEYPFGPEHKVYKVRGKMFMMQFELRGVPSINLKIDPLDGEVLRDAYPEINRGYHMNKKHWITVAGAGVEVGLSEADARAEAGSDSETVVGSEVLDADLLHDLVLESYCLVVKGCRRRTGLSIPRPSDGDWSAWSMAQA